MEFTLYWKIIILSLGVLLKTAGTLQVSRFFLGDTKSPFLLKLFLGALPFIGLQTFLSLLYWNDGFEHITAYNCVTAVKTLYAFLGIFYISSNFQKIPDIINLSYIKLLSILLCLYFPTLILATTFHPSYDSDTIIFWLLKLDILLDQGFFQKWGDSMHLYGYSSFILSFFSLILPKTVSHLEIIYSSRLILCLLLSILLWELSDRFKGFWRYFCIAIFLSGFPIKWINFYQDLWVATFILYWFKYIYVDKERKNPLNVFLSLAILAGNKNEGGVHSFFLTLISLWHYRHLFLNDFKQSFILLSYLPFIFWKICTLKFNLHLIQVRSLTTPEFHQRLSQMLKLFWEGLGRHYQSYFLDAAISSIFIILMIRKIPYTAFLAIIGALFVLAAPVAMVFWTSLDYEWLLPTTFSRITMPGCLLLIYIFINLYAEKKPQFGL